MAWRVAFMQERCLPSGVRDRSIFARWLGWLPGVLRRWDAFQSPAGLPVTGGRGLFRLV